MASSSAAVVASSPSVVSLDTKPSQTAAAMALQAAARVLEAMASVFFEKDTRPAHSASYERHFRD